MTTFQVPLPPRELSSNGSHGHWSKKATAKSGYRYDCQIVSRNYFWARVSMPDKVRLSLTFCIKGGKGKFYQPRDVANGLSAFKAGIDGLVDAGMCPDDSAKHLELGAIQIDSTRGPYVEVTVDAIHRVLGGKQ